MTTGPKTKIKFSGLEKPATRAMIVIRLTLFILAVITVYGILTLDYGNVDIPKAAGDTLNNFRIIFIHPYSRRLSIPDIFYEILVTIGLSVLITVFSGAIALFLGLLGAQNLSPKNVTVL